MALFMAMILCAAGADAYSILTHEELIDLAWNDSILSLLQAHTLTRMAARPSRTWVTIHLAKSSSAT
jgi:hypothetical protein